MKLRIGDTVMWRGGWGQEPSVPAVVVALDRVKPGEKYPSRSVKSISWADVRDGCAIVSLDNNHWAYGYQVEPMPDEVAA